MSNVQRSAARAVVSAGVLAAALLSGCSSGDGNGKPTAPPSASSAAVALDLSSPESAIRSVLSLAANGDASTCDGVYDQNGSVQSPLVYAPKGWKPLDDCTAVVTMFAQQYSSHAAEFATIKLEKDSQHFNFTVGSQNFQAYPIQHPTDEKWYIGLPDLAEMVGYKLS